ncbi:hypothetical protein GCM10010168_53960 [Actinoplanes ianthinogenes]|uniref:DUF3618 domain-containing protein n=1 Tax=Actinoplanes ianthinogenes TaxID=122358 RepID=A0ABN6CBE2_9ACTN|nr:DUF3618 domain-containing protein [Actinoplanes ianthinogenes]BCJ41606.1 hypothetical protein Aiant_22630 [Actinoplanes ianthinogenes]GGR28968.1 hypothetical protein GCM10010168_53960 [Actinoplanes ianthinogenes]
MSESNGTTAKPDLVALRAEIKQTRAELGDTVQALAARTDVKARAREQVVQVRERVRVNQTPLVLVAAGLAAVVGVILIVRGRRR